MVTFGQDQLIYQTTATKPESGMFFQCRREGCIGGFRLLSYPSPSNNKVLLTRNLHTCGGLIPTLENVISKFEGLLDGSIKKINKRRLEKTTTLFAPS
jgi:hypothetical protein